MDVGDPPEASSFHLCAELSKSNGHGANACKYAVVRDCAVCVLWAQLKGDPLQALLNILGVEVDDHPALSEVIGTLQSRSGLHLPSLRRRLKKAKTVVSRCVMYIAPSPAGSLMFSLTHRVGRRSSLCCGSICEVLDAAPFWRQPRVAGDDLTCNSLEAHRRCHGVMTRA